jgi:hypothetical protein
MTRYVLAFKHKQPSDHPVPGPDWEPVLPPIDINHPTYPGWENSSDAYTPDPESAPEVIWIEDMPLYRTESGTPLYPYSYVYTKGQNNYWSTLHPEVLQAILNPDTVCVGGGEQPQKLVEMYGNTSFVSGTEDYKNRWVLHFRHVDNVDNLYVLHDPDSALEQLGGLGNPWQRWNGYYLSKGLIATGFTFGAEQYDFFYEEDGEWYHDTFADGDSGVLAQHNCSYPTAPYIATHIKSEENN